MKLQGIIQSACKFDCYLKFYAASMKFLLSVVFSSSLRDESEVAVEVFLRGSEAALEPREVIQQQKREKTRRK
jgi:hypothetical protein